MLKLGIRNFKSIADLELELGRVNLFIGENGCGKTTILEAVGMAAAATNLNLSNSSFKDRGIRVTDPSWMRSAFVEQAKTEPVTIKLSSDEAVFIASLAHDDSPYGSWQNQVVSDAQNGLDVSGKSLDRLLDRLRSVSSASQTHVMALAGLPEIPTSAADPPNASKQIAMAAVLLVFAAMLQLTDHRTHAPREDVLRDLARDSDVEPIGVHGEGLFKRLEVLDKEGMLPAVKEQLALLGWFDDLSVAAGVNPSSRALQIRDIFLDGKTPFDQRSANEGFLFVLLYACLLISPYTPRFFAVDDVDTALSPKLCARTVQMFAELTKKHDRRVLLTAHNPGALDGLDLSDDEIRLFVVYRNTEGRTRARRILPADLPAGSEPVRPL